MKTIEQAAENYRINTCGADSTEKYLEKAFIAGAESVMKKATEAEKLKAALDVWDKSAMKSILSKQDRVESVPDSMFQYLIKSFEDASLVHGKIKRTATYGGSTFVIFEDDKWYKLNFSLYGNETGNIIEYESF